MNDSCQICTTKRAKRACPGLGTPETPGAICPACCGLSREVTIDCPLDCAFLMDARKHERPAPVAADEIPNRDIEVSEDFVRTQEHLVLWFCHSLARAMENMSAVDNDAREGLEAAIRSYRAQHSGLVYEARPASPAAASIHTALSKATEELRAAIAEESGMASLRDADLVGTLIFIQRLELQHNNGRRRGRAFYDFLLAHFPAKPAADVAQALAIGGAAQSGISL